MLNSFSFSGRLTKDVELRQTPAGKSVTTVTIANETGWGDNRKTHFFNVVLFEAKAEYAAKYGSKGQMALVCGEMQQRKYTDKDGNNRTVYEVQSVRTFDLIKTGEGQKPATPPADEMAEVEDSDDLPF